MLDPGSGDRLRPRDSTRSGFELHALLHSDAGTPVNPRILETQLTGAAIQHLGMTLFENMEFTDGQLRNPNLAEYKIPGIRDLPEQLTGEIVDAVQQSGPYGAKG